MRSLCLCHPNGGEAGGGHATSDTRALEPWGGGRDLLRRKGRALLLCPPTLTWRPVRAGKDPLAFLCGPNGSCVRWECDTSSGLYVRSFTSINTEL